MGIQSLLVDGVSLRILLEDLPPLSIPQLDPGLRPRVVCSRKTMSYSDWGGLLDWASCSRTYAYTSRTGLRSAQAAGSILLTLSIPSPGSAPCNWYQHPPVHRNGARTLTRTRYACPVARCAADVRHS